ncbi:hypothetical protein [Alcanivorax sp. DP30]|uniref:hypothetical protein n=1 Tax=Alcanivorax sp. DP30 TaxID=2606217 RepID=UPI00137095BB|nr:hypothetical protein [Alcanivorax sp. DP30]MZR63244.1 hypothetical protein [Alcanivorax sp. DP30]
MKALTRILVSMAAAFALLPATAWSAVGGGAVIHNAATLSFAGGQVTVTVDVTVSTVASAPVFDVNQTNIDSYPGSVSDFLYTISATANGSDTYNLSTSSVDVDVSAPGALTITPATVVLGASIASQDSDAAGNVYIPANSEADLAVGDRVLVTVSGNDYVYEIATLTPGTPTSTAGNSTTPETPTRLTLTPITGGAPAISTGVIPAGTQIGEQQVLTVQVTAGTPAAAGVNGLHTLTVSGSTTALSGGSAVLFDDGLNATNTVLSGEGSFTKEVRNVTNGGSFATSGVTATTGDVLEYQLTAASLAGSNLVAAVVEDTVPTYTAYVANSTTLNGNPVADAGTTPFPLDEGGIPVNTPSGASGELIDGESAIVIFQVTVD